MSIFENICFIKPDRKPNKSFGYKNLAPMFRKKFYVDKFQGTAKLYVCSLGYGYVYINGRSITKDIFTAPVSNYNKTIWYNTYNVTEFLKPGNNIIAIWCGNGWYNEEMKTSWNFNQAEWRDVPKTILRLDMDGKTIVKTDENWKVLPSSAVYFNQVRSGEYFDAREYDPDWLTHDYNDNAWENAILDTNPPKGIFRECLCEPIREFESFHADDVTKVSDKKYIFDIGQNIAGYVKLSVCEKAGTKLVIKYAEQINNDYSLQLNKMKEFHYPESEFQTDIVICDGNPLTWSPRFCYHGFRYIEITGIENIDDVDVYGVFVHQAVDLRTTFECSNERINQMFQAGIYSTYSNMYYSITDCPTREKMGWTNDAQSSAEQMLTDFKCENLLKKWMYDIFDAMDENGCLPGVIPTAGWGYEWGNGPVSDGVLFEIPYRIYIHTGDAEPLKNAFKYFKKYLSFIKSNEDADGLVRFGLGDWAKPGFTFSSYHEDVPVEMINALLIKNFYKITCLAAELLGIDNGIYKQKAELINNKIIRNYINADGSCKINQQTAVAMLIYYDTYNNLAPLKKQLAKLVRNNNYHHDCGMVGMRRLLHALNKCGLEEYAYKVITSKGYATYDEWFENGATTLWETWDVARHNDSKNHHMYSDFMSWLVKTVGGIKVISPAFEKVEITPYFFDDLLWAKCSCNTISGKIDVTWHKTTDCIKLNILVPKNIEVYYSGNRLSSGLNSFILQYPI